MSAFTASNNFQVLIGKSGTLEALATVQITDPTTTTTYLDDGQIVVLNSTGGVLTPGSTISDSPFIQLVQRSGSKLVFSNRIRGLDVTTYTGTSSSAAVEQISYIGYNGSSGSIDTSVALDMMLSLTYKFDESMWSEQLDRESYQHVLDVTPTQLKTARDFVEQINFKEATRPQSGLSTGSGFVKAEMLASGATSATANNAATSAVVTNGSNLVVFNGTYSSSIAVGTILRIGASLLTTQPVYYVSAISTSDTTLPSNSIKLSTAYQGTSDAAIVLDNSASGGIVGTPGNYGIKITGRPLNFGVMPYTDFKYLKVRFEVQALNMGSTVIATSTAASRGQGTYEQVAEMQAFAIGFEGALNRTMVPLPSGRTDAVSGTAYDCIQIGWSDRNISSSAIMATVPMKQQLYVFLANTAAQQVELRSQLNPWMASLPSAFTNVGAV